MPTGYFNIFLLKQQKSTFFSNLHGKFTKIEHIMGYISYLESLKNSTQSLFVDHNGSE